MTPLKDYLCAQLTSVTQVAWANFTENAINYLNSIFFKVLPHQLAILPNDCCRNSLWALCVLLENHFFITATISTGFA